MEILVHWSGNRTRLWENDVPSIYDNSGRIIFLFIPILCLLLLDVEYTMKSSLFIKEQIWSVGKLEKKKLSFFLGGGGIVFSFKSAVILSISTTRSVQQHN